MMDSLDYTYAARHAFFSNFVFSLGCDGYSCGSFFLFVVCVCVFFFGKKFFVDRIFR